MTKVTEVGDGWSAAQTHFSPAELEKITRLPQPIQRLWRSRGYLNRKEKGGWSRHSADDVAVAYLMNALSKLGVSPSEAASQSQVLAADLLFFALISGDGACDFTGPRDAVDAFRHRFEDDLSLARQVTRPVSEDRFIISEGGPHVCRSPDLCRVVEEERLENYYCIDLLVAGRRIVERAGRPLYCFVHEENADTGPVIRRLSHRA